ncbi:unnamed protein product [Didymodactylos carnosus]|uniref:Uncharacterized protein n=1 Tax=Didymodactylos carnosus TaxID=1234261 RepID=A0A814KY45_9BILA|nr:unnamed protein product [Didymodactylos carnosus]CAF1128812.1 unnamed protein product [Didymodactylos carnosus]CAF3824991.1 unnamed protein product [Didymodactylos carnosus]CAF3909783.1 unnamed protein product [Didymodactylos carnosus]
MLNYANNIITNNLQILNYWFHIQNGMYKRKMKMKTLSKKFAYNKFKLTSKIIRYVEKLQEHLEKRVKIIILNEENEYTVDGVTHNLDGFYAKTLTLKMNDDKHRTLKEILMRKTGSYYTHILVFNYSLFSGQFSTDAKRSFFLSAVLFYQLTRTMTTKSIRVKYILRCELPELKKYTIPIDDIFLYASIFPAPYYDCGNMFQHLFYMSEVHLDVGNDETMMNELILIKPSGKPKWIEDDLFRQFEKNNYDLAVIRDFMMACDVYHPYSDQLIILTDVCYIYQPSTRYKSFRMHYSNEVIPLKHGYSLGMSAQAAFVKELSTTPPFLKERKHLLRKTNVI